MSLDPGTRFGPYEILTLLGAGGMGEVYQARDDRLNRTVALKILPADLVTNAERRRRFIQEAQLASSLQHPNIITIFDIGSSDGGEYLAMELVRGRTLDTVIPKKGLRLQEALRYSIQITDALAAAHGAGIVHRDLKPGNIMVTDQGQIKILDFGLATLTEAEPTSNADETRVQAEAVQTGAGTILGTVAYMSPEQAEGKKVDARSDIFSFGSILYEMLSGKRAFRADSTPGTLAAVINLEPQPLGKVVEDVPQAVERLVSRCLRKDLTKRAQHASDIKLTLEELHEDSSSGSIQATPASASAPRARGRRSVVGIAIAVMVVALAGAAVVWWPREAPARAALAPVPLTTLPGSEIHPSFSPDGSQVAFTWRREGALASDVYVQIIGGSGTPLRLTDDSGAHAFPAWSPDGKSIALWHVPIGAAGPAPSRLTLNVVSPLGGPERQVLEWSGAPRRIEWSPDGRWLAVSPVDVRANLDRGITLVSPTTGERIEWTAIDKVFAGSAEPAFSPDGRRLAYTRPKDDFSADVYLASVGDDGRPVGQPTLLPYGGKEAAAPVWTVDGRDLLLIESVPSSNGGVIRVRVDGSRPAERIPGLEHPARAPVAVARSGQRLAFARGGLDVDIWRLDLKDQAASGRLAPSTLHEEGADLSPDGTRITFSSNRSGAREIWVADVTGENALALTQFGGPVPGTARWSPDGRQIAFDARPQGNSDIFVVSAGGGAVRQLTKEAGEDARPAWSHDGRHIYFSSDRSGRGEIWRISVDGSDPAQITKEGGTSVVASHDGEWLYYQAATRDPSIYRIHPDGSGDAVAVAENVRFLGFDTTARGLWFLTNPTAVQRSGTFRMLRATDNKIIDVATPDVVPVNVGVTVSVDDRYILFTRGDTSGTDLLLVNGFQ